MGREFELKYQADIPSIDRIREKFGDFTPISMETAYYDNPEGEFARRRWTLRRRWENGLGVCTLKTPAPDGSRGEWEVEGDDILASIPALCAMGAPAELAQYTANGLISVCGARFTRLAGPVQVGESVVELALDAGAFLGGGKEEYFTEVEVELKEGSEETVTAFAEHLAREFSLEPQPMSKHQRAMLLTTPSPITK